MIAQQLNINIGHVNQSLNIYNLQFTQQTSTKKNYWKNDIYTPVYSMKNNIYHLHFTQFTLQTNQPVYWFMTLVTCFIDNFDQSLNS